MKECDNMISIEVLQDFIGDYKGDLANEFIEKNYDKFLDFCEEKYKEHKAEIQTENGCLL